MGRLNNKLLIYIYILRGTDKLNTFDGLKWTNEKKSKSLNDNDIINEKKCENGVCSDSSISTADQKTCIIPKKVNIYIQICTYCPCFFFCKFVVLRTTLKI